MNKRGARIIALDVIISLIRLEADSPSALTCEGLDDTYGWEFSSDDQTKVWEAMDVIADQLSAKHKRSIDCLPEPKVIGYWFDGT